jgi:hypothetical protein
MFESEVVDWKVGEGRLSRHVLFIGAFSMR